MNGLCSSSTSTIKHISSIIALNLLLVLGLVFPGLGTWARRLFFLICACHELERIRVFSNMPLQTLNTRILKIKKPIVLMSVCEWSQQFNFRIDLDALKSKGFDLEKLHSRTLTTRELELLSDAIVKAAPSKFNYGHLAMYNDLQRILQENRFKVQATA